MKVPESLPKLLQAVKWSCRDDVAQVQTGFSATNVNWPVTSVRRHV